MHGYRTQVINPHPVRIDRKVPVSIHYGSVLFPLHNVIFTPWSTCKETDQYYNTCKTFSVVVDYRPWSTTPLTKVNDIVSPSRTFDPTMKWYCQQVTCSLLVRLLEVWMLLSVTNNLQRTTSPRYHSCRFCTPRVTSVLKMPQYRTSFVTKDWH